MERGGVGPDGLAARTVHAAQWRLASTIVVAASQLAVGVVLARLLPPDSFGLMAMVVVVLGLLQPFGELGIGAAVVQRAALTERHVRAAFTLCVIVGIACAALVASSASWVAAAMGDARVTPLVRIMAIAFAIRGAATVAAALMRRALDFKRQFAIDASASLAGSVAAVVCALSGYGVWSLVWGGLANVVLASAAQMIVARHAWRPLLARNEVAELVHFGAGSAAGGLMNCVARSGDNFVVGRWLGAASLGFYDRAYAWMNVPFTVGSGAASSVLFSAFAQAQTDSKRLERGYAAATQLTAAIAAPATVALAVAAPYLVPALYGPGWSAAVVPLQILCVAGSARALYHLGGIVVQSVGRVYTELVLQTAYALLVVGGSILARPYGLEGVAALVSGAIVAMFVATTTVALRIVAIPWSRYLRMQLPAFAATAGTAVAAVTAEALLVRLAQPAGVVALAILAAAALPWGAGLLWTLRQPELAPLRSRLPAPLPA